MSAIFEQAILLYLVALAVCGAAVTYIGARTISSRSKRISATALKDLLANDYYEAVSVLVPAYNSENMIVDTVRSLLNLQHPQFDITVVNDGSTDDTLERLVATFSLVEVPIAHEGGFETQIINVLYKSLDHANLTVIDKDHGGRADALNAGLNLARRPLVCAVDADVVLDPLALATTSRAFVEDETVVAVTALVRPDDEDVADIAPGWAQRFQEIDHARRTAQAAGWSALGATMDVEGFALYRRRALVEIGGWSTNTDAETLLALHRINRARDKRYRVQFTPVSVGHMHAEPGVGGLIRWRGRRARALAVALWGERHMLGRKTYGRIGSFASPLRWLFDVAAPFVEAAGYVYIGVTAALGSLDVTFAIAFALLAPGSRILAAQLATAQDAFTTDAHPQASQRLAIFASTLVEQIGIAQLSVIECVRQTVHPRGEPVRDEDAIPAPSLTGATGS